jgi:tRNA-splicing ligase RtcB
MPKLHPALKRINDTTLEVQNPQEVPTKIYAKEEVQIESGAVDELLNFIKVQDDLEDIGGLSEVVVTPDFHKGRGIPIGTVALVSGAVLPQAIGSDIGCGVQLLVTNVHARDLEVLWPQLQHRLRYLFFEGGRDIPMSPQQREAMLLNGPQGLIDTYQDNEHAGLWRYYDIEQQTDAANRYCGPDQVRTTFSFSGFIKGAGGLSSHDAQIGSIGGGNHFVEIQEIDDILDGVKAYEWKLPRNYCCIMVHSGSVSLGHAVGAHFVFKAKEAWPKGKKKPKSGFYGLTGDLATKYWEAEINAVNFAACNRLFLGLMVIRALSELLGRKVEHHLLYDAAHNWVDGDYGLMQHRKGACPAFENDPVLIPGSMGDYSYVLAGLGNQDALQSACHGAGRQMSRGKAMKAEVDERLRIVTPLDPESLQVRSRKDILKKYEQRLAEESPAAYKPVAPIIETVQEAGIANPVVRLKPLLTVKG